MRLLVTDQVVNEYDFEVDGWECVWHHLSISSLQTSVIKMILFESVCGEVVKEDEDEEKSSKKKRGGLKSGLIKKVMPLTLGRLPPADTHLPCL
jgi:hypothetical protein